MATTYEAPSYVAPAYNHRGFPGVIERHYEMDLATVTGDTSYALIAADVFKFFKLPANARISYARVETDVIDDGGTAATLDVIVSNGTTTWVLMDEITTSQTLGSKADTRDIGAGTVFYQADTIGKVTTGSDFYAAVRCGTGPTGDAAASALIKLTFGYVLSLEDGQNAI
jgi:hypothetical protein